MCAIPYVLGKFSAPIDMFELDTEKLPQMSIEVEYIYNVCGERIDIEPMKKCKSFKLNIMAKKRNQAQPVVEVLLCTNGWRDGA